MPEYKVSRVFTNGLRIMFLSVVLGGTAVPMLHLGVLYWKLSIATASSQFISFDNPVEFAKTAPIGDLPLVESAEFMRQARNTILGGLALTLAYVWIFVPAVWWFLKRAYAVSYSLHDTGIVRTRGKNAKLLAYSEIRTVAWSALRGLRLKTRSGSMRVSLAVEAPTEMIARLREYITAAGGQWPEQVFDKASVCAASGEWLLRYLWKWFVRLTALCMPVWFAWKVVSLVLPACRTLLITYAATGAVVVSAIVLMAGSLWASGLVMFRRAWKAGRRDMDAAFAKRTAIVSGLVTLVILALAAVAVWMAS